MMQIHTGEGEGAEERMAEFFGPGQIDHTIRQAIQFCWMGLAKERRNPEELEKQIRRLVDRALRDFHEDFEAFRRPK
jgi:hypothetical protein